MKRFIFKLEDVLRLRKFKEEECKIALGQAISALNFIENQIKQTALRHNDAASKRFLDPLNMSSWDIYIARLRQETQRLLEQAAKAELVVEEKRQEYLEASRDLKSLEELKKRQLEGYNRESEKEELDEIEEMTAAKRKNIEFQYL
jgi:flagellar export protein FliJ